MPTTSDLERLRTQLSAFESTVIDSVPPQSRRLVLLELARALDVLRVASLATEDKGIQIDWARWYSHAWPKALSLFLDTSTCEPGAPLFSSTNDHYASAKGVLHLCAEIAACDQTLALCRYGLAELVDASSTSYKFRIVDERVGLETEERDDQDWVRDLVARDQSPAVKSLAPLRDDVIEALDRNVRIFRDDYIGYDTEPLLDSYYEILGIAGAQLCGGQDLFPGDAMFGGHRFDLYRDAVGALIGWAIKHEAFCWRLRVKYPQINLRNVLTITAPLDELEESLAVQLDCSTDEARVALEMVTVHIGNKHLVRESGPAPMLVTIGDRRVIKSFAAAVTEPFFFMLRALQHRFRDDWYRAVDLREADFRNELYQVLTPLGLKVVETVKKLRLSSARILTDIDAAAFDLDNGVAALFQLKWQDPHGHSMTERNSRLRNFVDQSNKWVETVHGWASTMSARQVGQVLGLPEPEAARLRDVRLFVLSRYHAHYSGPNELDPKAAFGTWSQLCRVLATEAATTLRGDPVRALWEVLRARTDRGPEPASLGEASYRVGDVTVVVEG